MFNVKSVSYFIQLLDWQSGWGNFDNDKFFPLKNHLKKGCMRWNVFITISRYDCPCRQRGVDPANHPEHTQPGQVLSSFIHLEKLWEVCVDNRNCAPNAETKDKSREMWFQIIILKTIIKKRSAAMMWGWEEMDECLNTIQTLLLFKLMVHYIHCAVFSIWPQFWVSLVPYGIQLFWDVLFLCS